MQFSFKLHSKTKVNLNLAVLDFARVRAFNGSFPGLPRWAGTRKVKPIWILLKQETVSGSGINWAICKSAPRSRQHTSTPTTQFFTGRMPFLPPNQQRQGTKGRSRHWRHLVWLIDVKKRLFRFFLFLSQFKVYTFFLFFNKNSILMKFDIACCYTT